MPHSIDLLKQAIDDESIDIYKERAIAVYNEIIKVKYPYYIKSLMKKDYLSLFCALVHYTSFLFDKKSYETSIILEQTINKFVLRLDKSIIEKGDVKDIIRELHYKITQSYTIDSTYSKYYNITDVANCATISQYTLSILFLILAERLKLPIFGIPFHDKLVLCYAEEYCSDNELVFENDILYYIVVGEKDIVYTPNDLNLYALLLEKEVDLANVLPKNNQIIIQQWLQHILNSSFDLRTKRDFSSKYQQILSQVRELDNY